MVKFLRVFAMGLCLTAGCAQVGDGRMATERGGERIRVAHNVFFALKDPAPARVEELVTACYTYLEDHEGVAFFAAGSLVEEHQREVNVRDFQVGLHVVFADKAAHDAYQTSASHQAFIDQGKDNWAQVRVFDTYVP
jgi:hypothetical protein